MPQVFVVLDEGGRTLLTKAHGDIQIPSFPTVGLLCSISTYSEKQGFSIETFSTHNVRIVYRRFSNHLLFVLATSNILVHPDLLQGLLQIVYDGIVMLLGSGVMDIESSGKIDALRRKLRGLTPLDSLIADDTLVPCLMLSSPQSVGLPLRERADLRVCLEKIASACSPGGGYAALLSSQGYYLSGTPEWWMLQPRETLLLQHIATSAPEDADLDTLVYLSVKRYTLPLRLFCIRLEEGLQLLLLCNSDSELATVQPAVEEYTQRLMSVFNGPIWCSMPAPQFSGIPFDLAIITQRQPAHITVLWGHCSAAPQGFNPLMSPTLRRQFGSSMVGAGSLNSGRISTMNMDVSSPDNNMQLYYTSCVDLLVSFMLQSSEMAGAMTSADGHHHQQAAQQQRQHYGAAHAEAPDGRQAGTPTFTAAENAGSGTATPRGGSVMGSPGGVKGVLSPQRMMASFTTAKSSFTTALGRAPQASAPHVGDEVQLVTGSNRLVGLTDASPVGINVFVAFSSKVTRAQAAESASKLKAVFMMSYSDMD